MQTVPPTPSPVPIPGARYRVCTQLREEKGWFNTPVYSKFLESHIHLQGVPCHESPELQSDVNSLLGPLSCPFQDGPLYFTQVVPTPNFQCHHRNTGPVWSSQRHRTRPSQPIWPRGRANLGAGRSPSLLPQLHLTLPHWPSHLSVLTTLGACFNAVTDTDAGVQQLEFASHTAPERYTWRGHSTPPTLYALIHKRQLTSTCCTHKGAVRMKCDNDYR